MRNAPDQRLTEADPARRLTSDSPELSAASTELRAAILDEPREALSAAAGSRRRRPARRLVVLTASALLLAVAGTLGWQALDGRDGIAPAPEQAWAREALRIAAAVPRLLPAQPGWKIDRADSFNVEDGEVSFTRGKLSADLTWIPRSGYEDRVEDRTRDAERYDDVEVGDTKAVVIRYSSSPDDFAALWIHGNHTLELRSNVHIPKELQGIPMPAGEGQGPKFYTGFSYESFSALLSSLEEVSIDDWLSAMPASVVRPEQAEQAVTEMLEDIPQPDGFDVARVIDEDAVRDRYQLGAKVTGAVTCGWVKQWVKAIRAGDDDKRDEAAKAMASSKDWKILVEMQDEGAYPDWIWELSRDMQGAQVPTGAGGGKVGFEENAVSGLGCGPAR